MKLFQYILDLYFKFKDDKCIETNLNYHYNRNIYFIDNPFIFDRNDYPYSLSIAESHLINSILHSEKPNTLDKILAEEKLKNIYDKLSNAVNGKIVEKDKDFYLEEDFFYEPISVHNLSAGLKSFTIIKMLLERNALKEDDILILDEPEIHLHPKWQLLYAEIIVLLQKEFNIYILITTHSPYFLEAIEMYSKLHGMQEKTNYYLADIENKYSVFKLVNDSIEDIYNIMAQPIEKLEDLQNSFNE
ncbi:AAA family ATPase [Brachyspira pulli]|uniref:AAA family ATPase n=1 Tax=Brachyspira pulli TaxID=310721 RepID=UPI003004D193